MDVEPKRVPHLGQRWPFIRLPNISRSHWRFSRVRRRSSAFNYPWLDPATVTEAELRQAESHIRPKLDVGESLTSDPAIWAEFLQYKTFGDQKTRLKEVVDLERDLPEIPEESPKIM